MRRNAPFAKALVVLCLLVLQGQILASTAMACAHDGTSGGGATSVCPFHPSAGAADLDYPGGLLDCQRCVLGWCFGAWHPVLPALPPDLSDADPVEAGNGVRHFYRFVPDGLHRPPIPLSV